MKNPPPQSPADPTSPQGPYRTARNAPQSADPASARLVCATAITGVTNAIALINAAVRNAPARNCESSDGCRARADRKNCAMSAPCANQKGSDRAMGCIAAIGDAHDEVRGQRAHYRVRYPASAATAQALPAVVCDRWGTG